MAGIKVTRKSMGCRELKDRMLLGSTLVIALVDKTRLAGHSGLIAGQGAGSLGLSMRMMLPPGYTGEGGLPCLIWEEAILLWQQKESVLCMIQ